MQQTDPSHQSVPLPPSPSNAVESAELSMPDPEATVLVPAKASHLRHFRVLYLGILAILLLIFVPPLVNLNRYQRRIATSIGNSLGRPVHLSRVSLTILPLPGFTIDDLVVGEDPAFGSEPLIRANTVHATLRFSSLWRGRVEFSTISFTDPSVNLVHTANGQWNIESVLLQAARIETAPTAQRHAGPAPRFPYIEATGARLNFKQDQEKLPFSLTDADFSLWLPDPHQWHLRLRAHPDRTDSNVTDTGTIEFESTLGEAPSLSLVPLNLEGQWRDAQLGEASRVLFGYDAGWRGQMNLSAHIRGTFGESAISTRLRLIEARPADFVPEKPLTAEAECFATATGLFHAFEDLRCTLPPAISSHSATIALTGNIPNVHHFAESSLQLGTAGIPASTLISWLRATNQHVPEDLTATGTLVGSISYLPQSSTLENSHRDPAAGRWQGQFTLNDATLKAPLSTSNNPVALLSSTFHLHSSAESPAPHHRSSSPAKPLPHGFFLAPTSLLLGGQAPATIEGHFDRTGYTLHLTGSVTETRLKLLAQALPPFGDGLIKALPENHSATSPFHIDLTANRPWKGQQTWLETFVHPEHPTTTSRARRPRR